MSLGRPTETSAPAGLPIGSMAGQYQVLSALGRGGVGTVYSARDTKTNRLVAVKLLRGATAKTAHRLKNEFRTLADLQHRNIVVPYELFQHDEQLCYSMELVDGVSIVEHCATRRAEPEAIREVLLQLVDALEVVHGHSIVHRDLKPDNVLVTAEGRVVLLDFGIAKTVHEEIQPGITSERSWVGTPPFMAPEQFRGADPSPSTDWYAFGVLAYECLTGREAFPQQALPALFSAKQDPHLPGLPEGDAELRDVLARLVSPDPDDRPAVDDVRLALRQPREREHTTQSGMGRRTRMVGRREELDALARQLEGVCVHGRVRAVGVRGPAGIGKSVVIDAFAAKARREQTAFVSSARGSTLETLPLRLIDSLLDDLVSHALSTSRVPIERCYPRHADQLCAVFPCTAVLFGDDAADLREHGVEPNAELALRAVSDFLARLAEHIPLVLVFDDLDSAELDSFDAVLRLMLDLSESPVLFVFGSRGAAGDEATAPQGGEHGFLADCRRYLGADGVLDLELPPMPPEQLISIAWEELSSFTGPSGVVEALCEAAGGNPGMTAWFARALGSDPIAASDGLGRAIVLRAWRRLSVPAKDLVGMLALAGSSLPRRVAYTLLADSGTADQAVRDLEHHGFVRRGRDEIRLWHEQIGARIAAELSDLTQRHGRLAQAFVDAEEDLGRAARHFERCGSMDRALRCYTRAAEDAQQAGAHRRATVLLKAALRHTGDDSGRADLLRRALADSLGRIGRLRESAELFRRLAGSAEDPSSVAMRRQAISYFGALADADRVRELIEVELPTETGLPLSGAPLLARIAAARLRIAARPPWKGRPRRNPPPQWRRQLEALWSAASRLLHIEPILAAYLHARHLVLAFRAGDEAHQARALAFEAVMLTSNGGERKLTLASTLLAAAERNAWRDGDKLAEAYVHQGAGFMWANVGRFQEAITEGRQCIEALQQVPDLPSYELNHAHLELGWRLLMVGYLSEILSMVPDPLRKAIESEDPVLATGFNLQAATARLAAGRPEEAERHLAEARRWCPSSYEVGHYALFSALLALALYRGEVSDALQLIERQGPRVDALRIMSLPSVGAIHRYRVAAALMRGLAEGLAPDPRRTRRQIDALYRKIADESFPVAIAHARLLEAGLAGTAGDAGKAMGLLREAADRFTALGWDNLACMARMRYREQQGAPADPRLEAEWSALGVTDPKRWSIAILPPTEPGASRT